MLKLGLPLIIAHKGANTFAPENSLPAFAKALDMGCDGIELDVRLCASGHVMVFHDRSTFRMTGMRHHIHRLTLDQIKKLRLDGNTSPEFHIPTLSEVLELVGDNMLLNIEIKKETITKDSIEERILASISEFGLRDNVIISSFNPWVLKKVALLAPEVALGFVYRSRSQMMMLNEAPVTSMHASYRVLSRRHLKNLRERGLKVFAWTVDREDVMIDMIKKGVDGIITNKPEFFFALKEKHQWN